MSDTNTTNKADDLEVVAKAKKAVTTQSIHLESNYSFYLVVKDSKEIFAAFSELEIKDSSIILSKGLVDRFQLIKYLRPRNIEDVTVNISISKLPSFTLVFDTVDYINQLKSLKPSIGRAEIELSCSSFLVSTLPGDKMAVNKAEFDKESSFSFISTEFNLSQYKGKSLWNMLSFKPSEVAAEISDFI